MKLITEAYKENIKTYGRQLDSKVTYTIGGVQTELDGETLNSVTPLYNGDLLKSVMKEIDIDSNVEIPVGTILNYQLGVKTRSGKNLLNWEDFTNTGIVDDNGTISTYNTRLWSAKISVTPNTTYTFKTTAKSSNNENIFINRIIYYNQSGAFLSRDATHQLAETTFTIPNNVYYIVLDLRTSALTTNLTKNILEGNTQLELGNQATSYEAYGKYDYIDYGNYIVNKVEKQEDTRSYMMTCYDKMLYSMKDYEDLGITYPITIKNYIIALSNKLGLSFANEYDFFANYDKEITKELYLDEEGYSLDYTYRDVLDQLAQVTASTICINNNDELELRYIKDIGEITNVSGINITINNNKRTKISDYQLKGNTEQNGTPTPDNPVDIEVVTGRQEIDVYGKNINSQGIRTGLYTIATGDYYNSTTYVTTNDLLPIEYGKTITISTQLTRTDNFAFFVLEYDENKTYLNINSGGTWGKTATYTIQNAKTKYVAIDVGGNATIENVGNIQVEYGNQKTDFEPYKGQSYEVNLGKNLLDYNNSLPYANYGITLSRENNNYKLYGTSSGWFYKKVYTIPANSLNGTYIYSKKMFSGTNLANIRIIDRSVTPAVQMTNPFTITNGHNDLDVEIVTNNSSAYDEVFNIQLEKGSIVSEYAPYFTPIELCKIGDYQDSIKKGTGKNLLDTSTTTTVKNQNGDDRTGYYCKIPKTGTYFVLLNTTNTLYWGKSTDISSATTLVGNTSATYSTNYNFVEGEYFVIWGTKTTTDLMMVTLLSNGIDYEPYGYKDKWYIEKKIGKVTLVGTETISYGDSGETGIKAIGYTLSTMKSGNYLDGLSNYFHNDKTGKAKNSIRFGANSNIIFIYVDQNEFTSADNFKTWLSTHNTNIYYILATPTYALIDNEELINQLNRPQLLLGLNNINVSASMPTPLSLSYYSSIETIDEEQLKDINVKTAQKYGPINSIVLSRSGESDNVYLQDENSIEENGLCELKIIDNQIMNWQDRSDYLPDILEQLNGLEYYTNDYSSTGITYLELCDGYDLKIGNNVYNCIMFNDEVDITQGLEEQIHTDMPTTSETDYKKADKTDRKINQAFIIVDKQQNEITAQANRINIIATNIDETNGDIQAVTTSTGFTFDANGLNVSKNDTTYNTLIDNTGMYNKDGTTTLAQFTKDGAKIKDLDIFGYNKYGEDNIESEPMFIAIKYHNDTTNEDGYGHFYNG